MCGVDWFFFGKGTYKREQKLRKKRNKAKQNEKLNICTNKKYKPDQHRTTEDYCFLALLIHQKHEVSTAQNGLVEQACVFGIDLCFGT